MRALLTVFALSSVASSLTLQARERTGDEYAAVSSLLSEAGALLQEFDAHEMTADEDMAIVAESDPNAPAAEAAGPFQGDRGKRAWLAMGFNMSCMVDIVLALPEALQDDEFVEDFRNVTKLVDVNVRKFMDQTQQKTSQFVKDSKSASDVELRFVMAKFFHESGLRLRGLHQDSLKAIQKLRRTAPEDLERALFPFLGQLNANTVRLSMNATSLATATPKEACNQISQIMANVSDYDYKLETIGKLIENVFARVLPNMEKTLKVAPNITTFVGSFLNMARLEVDGLREAAHGMVTRASPIIAERVQCTFSNARPRIGFSLLCAVAVLATTWLLHWGTELLH
jgi:hypothetical protein